MFKNKKLLIGFLIFLSLLLGFSSLYTPKPMDKNYAGFSTERAKEDIKEISKDVHSVLQQENLAEVRNYLLSRLNELGLEPEVFTYEDVTDKYGNTYDLNNIYATIDGKDGENGNYIMLATHYDSSPKKRDGEDPNSKGAADSGYGLSTILEIVKIIKEKDIPLENGIKILITDAEETGLLGAKYEMENNFDLYENVSFVVNIEARGVKGPAIMFETSNNNSKVIDLFKEANLPVSYSLAADVYRKMPNGSDFTEFNNKEIPGINIAVLDSLDYYHTYRDNYDNISDTSIQHYGEQILPIVEEFIYSSEYSDKSSFESDENSIFFTFLPNVFISYSNTVGAILAIVSISLLSGFILYNNKNNNKVNIVSILKLTSIALGLSILALLIGVLVSFILSKIYNMKFSLTYMPKIPIAHYVTLAFVLLFSISFYIVYKRLVNKGICENNLLLGGLVLNSILLLVFMFVLPGGSYLFLFPIMLSLLYLLTNNKRLTIAPIMFSIIMYAPLLYILYIALTIGALGILLLLLSCMLCVVVPCILIYTKKENTVSHTNKISI